MRYAILYSRAAQFEGLSEEASYRLQKVGGMVLGMVKQEKRGKIRRSLAAIQDILIINSMG